ncbi:MAG: hypothetical protein KDC48_20435 [Planctomycetes bacterium]|nr:hypothetical protein [Planctomycetota bacterium]
MVAPTGVVPDLPASYRAALDASLRRMRHSLGANLWSCVLYGSAVRGDLVAGVSDLNLLIVLERSTADAHAAIAEDLLGDVDIDPMVLTRRGLERSLRCFASKFRSIRRHYRVLHGDDPFAGYVEDPDLLRFLDEQALRNLRLRAVHAFIRFGRDPVRYRHYLLGIEAALFTHLSDPLRLDGQSLPQSFAERIPLLEAAYGCPMPVLEALLALKEEQPRLSVTDVARLHRHLFDTLDHVVRWVEDRWPA